MPRFDTFSNLRYKAYQCCSPGICLCIQDVFLFHILRRLAIILCASYRHTRFVIQYQVSHNRPLSPSPPPCRNSASYAGMNEWEESAKDAAQCIKVNKGFVKGAHPLVYLVYMNNACMLVAESLSWACDLPKFCRVGVGRQMGAGRVCCRHLLHLTLLIVSIRRRCPRPAA